MKRMKIAFVAMLAIFMGTTFTSCLDSDSGSSFDGSAIVTTNSYMGTVTSLITDDGYTLTPSNPNMLQYTDGTYVKRCEIAYAWNEGVVFDGDKSKPYGITIVQVGSVYPVRDYTQRPDTIENNFPITEISNFWGANGNYLTAVWKFNYTSTTEVVSFELYPEKVEDNVLIMRLRQSLGSAGTNSSSYYTSFTMPRLSDINSKLGTNLTTTNDSISVKLAIRKSSSSEDLTNTSAVKVKVNY